MEQSSEPQKQDIDTNQTPVADTVKNEAPAVTTPSANTDDLVYLNTSAEIKQEAEELFLAREAIYVEAYNTELVQIQQWHNKKMQYFTAQREYLLSKLAFAQRQLKNGKSSIKEVITFFNAVADMHKAQKEAAQKTEIFKSMLGSNPLHAPLLPYQAITDASILSLAALSQFYYDTHTDHDEILCKTQKALSELRSIESMRDNVKQSEKQIQSTHTILKDFYTQKDDCEKRLQQYVSSVESYLWKQNQVNAFICKQRKDIFKEKVRYIYQFIEMAKIHEAFIREADMISTQLLEETQNRMTAIQQIIENYTIAMKTQHGGILHRLDALQEQVKQSHIQADEYHRIGYEIIDANSKFIQAKQQQAEEKQSRLSTPHEADEDLATAHPQQPQDEPVVEKNEEPLVKEEKEQKEEVEDQQQPQEDESTTTTTTTTTSSSIDEEQPQQQDAEDVLPSNENKPTDTTATTTTLDINTNINTDNDDDTIPVTPKKSSVVTTTTTTTAPHPIVSTPSAAASTLSTTSHSSAQQHVFLATEHPVVINIIPPPNYKPSLHSGGDHDDTGLTPSPSSSSLLSSTSAFSLLSPILQLGREKTPALSYDTEYYPKLQEIAQQLVIGEELPREGMVLKTGSVTRKNALGADKNYTMVFTKNRFIHLTHMFALESSKSLLEVFQEQSEIEIDGVYVHAAIDKDHPTYIQLKPESSSLFGKTITLDVKNADEAVDWVALINSHNINHSYT